MLNYMVAAEQFLSEENYVEIEIKASQIIESL